MGELRFRAFGLGVALALVAAPLLSVEPRSQALSFETVIERVRKGSMSFASVRSYDVPKHGGRGIVHYAGGRHAPPKLQKRAPRGVVYSTDTFAAEPTLGVNRKGHLFYVGLAIDSVAGLPRWPVLESRNGGRNWKEISPRVGPLARHFTGFDPMLYLDPKTDRLFTADLQLPHMCSFVSFTDDEGKNWTTSKACGLADHQNVFAGPPTGSPTVGYPNVVYYCAIDGGALADTSTLTSCLKSLDGGLTWVRTGTPAYTDDPRESEGQTVRGHCSGTTGHGYVDRKGTVYLPRGWCGHPYLAISRDEGATWTRVRVANRSYGMPSGDGLQEHEAAVAVDAKGNIYYFWTDYVRMPYITISRNGGKSWSKPMMIGVPGLTETWGPTMAIAGPGKIAVAYLGTKNGTDWNGYITMTTNALASKPLFYSGRVNAARDSLLRGNCGILRCGLVYDFIDIVITPKGVPVATFVTGCRNRDLVRCGDFSESDNAGGLGLVGALVGGPRLR